MNKYGCITKNIIPITQGSDYSDTVLLKNTDGSAMNLTGYTVRSQLRNTSGQLVGTFVTTIATPATLGSVGRTLPKAQTALLVPSETPNHVWGLELTSSGGITIPEIQGGALVTAEVVK